MKFLPSFSKSKFNAARRYVDMWMLPGVHPTNLELLQLLKTADTHHFSKNMDVVGTVSGHETDSGRWKKTHLIGVRSDIWRPDAEELAQTLKVLKRNRQSELKQGIKRSGRLNADQSEKLDEQVEEDQIMQMETGDIEKRRLVLKLFKITGKRARWCGTIEEVTTEEVHNSIGSKRSLLSMAVMLPRTDAVTRVQQNHRTFRIPSIFTFCYHNNDQMWHVSLKRRWVSIGADFDVEANGTRFGKLDGRLVSLGADSYVNLGEHDLSDDTQFNDILTLFTASVGYHRAMRRSIKRRVQAAHSGEAHRHVIDGAELRLRHNGRAAA